MKNLFVMTATLGFLVTTSISQASMIISNDCTGSFQQLTTIGKLADQEADMAKSALQEFLKLGPKPYGQLQAQRWEAEANYFQEKINKASALHSKLTAMAILNGLGDLGICYVNDGQDQ